MEQESDTLNDSHSASNDSLREPERQREIDTAPAVSVPLSQRDRVVQELVATEHTYVSRLQTTLAVFVQPLRSGGVLSEEELEGQFGCWEQIAACHTQFLAELEHTPSDSIGPLMTRFCSGLTMYQPYLLIFEGALRKRAKLLLSNRRLSDLLDAARLDPRCEGLSLESFLVLPVQRIPRYKLLLDEVRKLTPQQHPDYANIAAACDKIKEVATENNEAFHRREADEQLMRIMTSFDPMVNLLEATRSRRLIKEGDMQKQCRKGMKEYRFWLFSDLVLYGVSAGGIGVQRFHLKHMLPLEDVLLTKGAEHKFNGCDLIFKSTAKSFFCCASSTEDRDAWFQAYSNAFQKLNVTSSAAIVAMWRPDESSGLCSGCNAQFGLFVRRHHCRRCGLIVCAKCSPNCMPLGPNVEGGNPVRVCTNCFSGTSTAAPPVPVPTSPAAPVHSISTAGSVSVLPPQSPPHPPVPKPDKKPPTPGVLQDKLKDNVPVVPAASVVVTHTEPASAVATHTEPVSAQLNCCETSRPAPSVVQSDAASTNEAVVTPPITKNSVKNRWPPAK